VPPVSSASVAKEPLRPQEPSKTDFPGLPPGPVNIAFLSQALARNRVFVSTAQGVHVFPSFKVGEIQLGSS